MFVSIFPVYLIIILIGPYRSGAYICMPWTAPGTAQILFVGKTIFYLFIYLFIYLFVYLFIQ